MWLFGSKKIKEKGDDEIIAEYKRSGDTELIGLLFEKYAAQVYGVCLKYLKDEDESKDAVGNIFEKLIQDLKKFEIRVFSAWLHTVTKNHCMMKLRKDKSESMGRMEDMKEASVIEMISLYESDDHLPESRIVELEHALNVLAEEQRLCIELFYLKEKCYQEIAGITGYNMNQVKSFIQNGKRNLKIQLAAK
jgi:RNA polymerase sigma factor (sigma-70 family)